MTHSRSVMGMWSRSAFINVVFPDPVPPAMMPFFFSAIMAHNRIPYLWGMVPEAISSSTCTSERTFEW